MNRPSILWCSIALAALTANGCGSQNPTPQIESRLDSKAASQALFRYLATNAEPGFSVEPKDYDVKVELLGKSTLLVFATYKRISPNMIRLFVVDDDGVRKATLENLIYAHTRENSPSSEENDHRRAIEKIVRFHSADGHGQSAMMIASTKEIPGYDRFADRRLDADVESVVRASWKSSSANCAYVYYITYTYNIIGGIVSRYKFQFNGTNPNARGEYDEWQLYTAEHIILGRKIGGFQLRR